MPNDFLPPSFICVQWIGKKRKKITGCHKIRMRAFSFIWTVSQTDIASIKKSFTLVILKQWSPQMECLTMSPPPLLKMPVLLCKKGHGHFMNSDTKDGPFFDNVQLLQIMPMFVEKRPHQWRPHCLHRFFHCNNFLCKYQGGYKKQIQICKTI